MLAQSLSCPRPSFAFWRPEAGRLFDRAAQPNERLRQTRFDPLPVEVQVLGDLLQRQFGEAMEDEDVATIAWQSADRPG